MLNKAKGKLNGLKKSCYFSNMKVCLFFVTFICYMFLVIFCIITYLEPQIRKFLQRDKTFATTITEVNEVDMPTMIICANPEFKSSTSFDLNYVSMNHLLKDKAERYKNVFNLTMFEALEELTYDFEEDFVVKHVIVTEDGDEQGEPTITLKYGMNQNKNYILNMSRVATARHGMCCLIQSSFKISEIHEFRIVYNIDLLKIDMPDNLELYFVSKNAWQGIVDDDWIHVAPSQYEMRFEENKEFRISQLVKITFMEGHENVTRCQEQMFEESDCSTKCFPLKHNYLDMEPCNSYEEANCMIQQASLSNTKCVQSKETLQYRMEKYYGNNDVVPDPLKARTVKWTLSFPLTIMEVKEEILIISPEDMIGYTGGALGLFIGFSCFEYFTRLLDRLIMKCRTKKQSLILNEKIEHVMKV